MNITYGPGEALHGTVRHLLSVAYELLDRDAFATILQVRIHKTGTGIANLNTIAGDFCCPAPAPDSGSN